MIFYRSVIDKQFAFFKSLIMKRVLILLAFFGLISSIVLPLHSAVTTTLALLIVVAVQRAANHHLCDKPQLLSRIRRRLLMGMSVGLLVELVFKAAVGCAVHFLLWKFLLQKELVIDVKLSEYVEYIESAIDEFLERHPSIELGWGMFLLTINEAPCFSAALLTPWVLTWDYFSLTMVHSHVEEITRLTVVKDIVAFSAAAASGMRITYVLFWWFFDLTKQQQNKNDFFYSTVQRMALDLMLLVQTSAVIIVCQMAFCIAAAERDVLDRKGRIWAALANCVIVAVPFYLSQTLLAIAPVFEHISKILYKFLATLLTLAVLEHTRRRYCGLLSAARQKDAELHMLPARYTQKLS